MTVAAGARLGPYEVLAPLDTGGMGEVYRARDTTLGREVALKVLPADLSRDPERRRRFEQEARAASALNHPHIVGVFGVGTSDGTDYIALELVEGRTLRDLLFSGPLPLRRVLDLAIQTADGLAKAHAAGIVHRDLKPENVMVSKDGFAKILDFGLAKLAPPLGAGREDQATSPRALTDAGVILGTAGYMSPEQASGHAADFRSDQFSFGSILYEMATGQRAFHRETAAETLAAVIREEPAPLARARADAPVPLRWIVEQCLAKDPEERYASTRDLVRDLRNLRDHLSETSDPGLALPAPRARRRRWAVAAFAAVAASLVAFETGRRVGGGAEPPSFRRLTFGRGAVWSARFSPDGQTVIYGASWEGRPLEVFATRTDSPESRSLGLPPADILAVSSTGEMALSLGRHHVVGWETSGTLARMSLAGGAPREVAEGVDTADWSPDGRELVLVRDADGRRRLEYPPGRVLYETTGHISHARVSPRGDRVAFLDHPLRGNDSGGVAVVDLAGNTTHLSAGAGSFVGLAWRPDGEEIWFTAAKSWIFPELRAVTLQGRERLVLRGPGRVVLQDIGRDGRVLLVKQGWRREIRGLPPGREDEVGLSWLDWSYPQDLSADGTTLLFEEQGEGAGAPEVVYLRGMDGSAAIRLGEGRGFGLSPDGQWVVAAPLPATRGELVLMPTRAGQPRPLVSGGLTCHFASWFPDGRRILVSANETGRGVRLFVLDATTGARRAITEEGTSVLYGHPISPDGSLVTARAPDGTLVLVPVEGGGTRPVSGIAHEEQVAGWTGDGRGLYVFRTSELPARVEIVDVATGRRTFWRNLAPPDPAGVSYVGPVHIARDGRSYAFSYRRFLDDLYLVEGLR